MNISFEEFEKAIAYFEKWATIADDDLSINIPRSQIDDQPSRLKASIEENKRAQKALQLQRAGKRFKRFL